MSIISKTTKPVSIDAAEAINRAQDATRTTAASLPGAISPSDWALISIAISLRELVELQKKSR